MIDCFLNGCLDLIYTEDRYFRSLHSGKRDLCPCSVFLEWVSFKKTLVCEKWFAESYVKVYADFHESKIVLVMSHGQKYFVFHVKRHHIDANPWGVRWVTPYTTIILKGRFAWWQRWLFHVGNIESLIPSTLRLRWINSLVTKRQHDHMDMMEEWPVEDHWLLGRSTITWSDVICWIEYI